MHADRQPFSDPLARQAAVDQPEHLAFAFRQEMQDFALLQFPHTSGRRMDDGSRIGKRNKERVVEAEGQPEAVVERRRYVEQTVQRLLVISETVLHAQSLHEAIVGPPACGKVFHEMEEMELLKVLVRQVLGMDQLQDRGLPDRTDLLPQPGVRIETQQRRKASVTDIAAVGMHVAQHGDGVLHAGIDAGQPLVMLQHLGTGCLVGTGKLLTEKLPVQLVHDLHMAEWLFMIIAGSLAATYLCKGNSERTVIYTRQS